MGPRESGRTLLSVVIMQQVGEKEKHVLCFLHYDNIF